MKKGFTLVEIMIVVAIIALLAAIAIPNLLRSRISAQEAAAAGAMHTLVAAETQWRATHSAYANLGDLDSETPPYIDSSLAGGTKQGYSFAITVDSTNDNFFATAVPQSSNAHCFYVDEDGVVFRSNSATCNTAVSSHEATAPSGYSQIE
jgi:prepilin-type N-terminal cleavage/methylation domain-containing protein